jgi:cytochrome c-type biogenesis protein CcmH/NrfF
VRRTAYLLALLAAATALSAAAPAAGAAQASTQPRASLPDVEDEVMCPICGTALNLSQAPQADRERAFIRREIARGRTKEEIKQALVNQYGGDVLATPDASGFDLAAWIVPGVGIALVALALLVGVRRWRRRGAAASEEAEPEPLEPDDEERLRSDLARYDL